MTASIIDTSDTSDISDTSEINDSDDTNDTSDTSDLSDNSDDSVILDTSHYDYSYSREATVAAVRDYYRFLTSMYLDEAKVLEPPEGGWPKIPVDGWPNFNKTDEVLALLRELPYIRVQAPEIHGAPDVVFADWQGLNENLDGLTRREWSEPDPDMVQIPAHIVGLTVAQGRSPAILLDTELGVIYWYECHGEIKEGFHLGEAGDAYDWLDHGLIDEDQVEWRQVCGIWTVADFFENLKANFRELIFVPLGFHEVDDIRVPAYPELEETRNQIKHIYCKHGWPDMTKFNKEACSADIRSYLEVHDPDYLAD